ncbi:MAG: hypothetical protein FWE88_00865 [Phycisphaerae bacterium]|nr:hypothetical protein [Phycisphaerae bacterium]
MSDKSSLTAATAGSKAHPWIWVDEDVLGPGQVAWFRLRFDARRGQDVRWTGFADSMYTLYFNGREMGVGPCTGLAAKPRLTTWNLSSLISDGSNVLALEVWFDDPNSPPTDVDIIQAGVLGWLSVDDQITPTGTQWKACRIARAGLARKERRSFAARRITVLDLRGRRSDWHEPFFDDSRWASAVVVGRPDPYELRHDPLGPLTSTVRPVASLIDAGVATGGGEVQFADDVAARMKSQSHRSLVRNVHRFTVLSTEEREGLAISLPRPHRLPNLQWTNANAAPTGPVRIPPCDGEFYLCVDFGMQTSGQVWLDIDCANTLSVDLGYADHLRNGRVDPLLQQHAFADRLILSKGRQYVHLPTDRGFRYLQMTFSGEATLHEISVREHVYPIDTRTRFACSDPTLNSVFALAQTTARQCSLHSHVDNARRERQGWGGPDLYAQAHGFFHIAGDLRLTRKMLEDYVDSFDTHGFIPNFCPSSILFLKWISAHDLWFPIVAWDYIMYSDDRELAPRLLAASQAVLDFYRPDASGLILRAHENACRWTEWNMNSAFNASTWENLLAIVAWRSVSTLQRYLGVSDADQAADAANALAAAVNARLWHEEHNALAQGTMEDGSLSDFCAQVDNAFALRHDIIPPDRAEAAYRFCAGRSGTWPTSRSGWQGYGQGERVRYDPRKPVVAGTPFTSSLCAQTIAHLGSPAEVVQYLRYNFGAMIDEGEGGLWEMWPIFMREDVASTCFSQGYGIHIAATLIGDVLGLRFASPGGRELTFTPRNTGLAWIEGEVQTVHGIAHVRREGAKFQYNLPAGVTLRIITGPAKSDQKITGQGVVTVHDRRASDRR